MPEVHILVGDARERLRGLASGSVQTCVTSPPYFGLRDYGVSGQIGLEQTPDEYVTAMVGVFREVWRVLADDGTCWINIGDSYANGGRGYRLADAKNFGRAMTVRPADGAKPKDLLMIPARVALALQADGWTLRSEIIWAKPNPMPESVKDRPTCAHEKVFLLTKGERYYYDADAVREPLADQRKYPSWEERKAKGGGSGTREIGRWDASPHGGGGLGANSLGRNLRNVWAITPRPFPSAHFATFPPELPERCILAGSRPGDTVLDPFGGAGTTGMVADRLGRNAILCELNPEYAAMAEKRIADDAAARAAKDAPLLRMLTEAAD